tara:strand:- start:5129 stop:5341 length:213 start_codon:yes stop_codon:yes gene_type:complete
MSLLKLLKKNPEELSKMSNSEKVEQFKTATQERNVSFTLIQGFSPFKVMTAGVILGIGVSYISHLSSERV